MAVGFIFTQARWLEFSLTSLSLCPSFLSLRPSLSLFPGSKAIGPLFKLSAVVSCWSTPSLSHTPPFTYWSRSFFIVRWLRSIGCCPQLQPFLFTRHNTQYHHNFFSTSSPSRHDIFCCKRYKFGHLFDNYVFQAKWNPSKWTPLGLLQGKENAVI